MFDADAVTGLYIDRAGKPISFRQWEDLMADEDYRHLRAEVLPGRGGEIFYVSTIWTGLNLSSLWGSKLPIVYETAAFNGDNEMDGRRWCTDQQALLGHEEIKGRIAQDWWLDLGGRA